LGIDLGDRRISAVLVEKTEQGVRVVAAGTGELPLGDAKRPSSSAKALSRLLRTLGRRAAARGVRTAVAVSTGSVIMRLLDLPKQMPANVSEFVDNELKQYVALSGRSMSSDFCGVGTGCGASRRLLAVAADAAEMEQVLGACRPAGVAVESVEPAALAYARACLAGEKDLRYGHALIATLSRCNLVVCLLCNGTLDFVRIREVPLGMETPEALCAWVAEELNAVLRYCRTDAAGESPAWHARLAIHDAAYPKDRIASALVLEPGVKTFTIADWRESSEAAGSSPSPVAVGAAMKLLDVEGDELRIDLTPPNVTRARSSSRRGLILANAAAVLFLGIFLVVQLLAKTTDAMNQRIQDVRVAEQLSTMPALVTQDRYVDAEILRMKRKLTGLEAVRTRRDVDWPTVLSAVAQETPIAVCITHLACDDSESLSLKGLAVSAGDAKAFVQSLDGKAPFASVRLSHMQRRQAGADVVEYEIICTLKPMKESDGGQGA
jgi:Tfp pilus assembly protein PilN